MSLKSTDMMAGYAMLERPRRKLTNEHSARTFEVFDTESLTKETLNIEAVKPKAKKKRVGPPKTVMDMVEPKGLPEGTTRVPHEYSPEVVKEEEAPPENVSQDLACDHNEYHLPELRSVVKVYSDITEITIDAVHVFMDDHVVCIFMDKDAPTKLKPKKGISMDIEALGRRVTVYSPGVYVPVEPFGCDMVFLLVQNEGEE